MFRSLLFLILLIYAEVKTAGFIHSQLVFSFGKDAAFFMSLGYFFLTIYAASQIIKGSGMSQLRKFRENMGMFASEGNEFLDAVRRVTAAILLFMPGYLTDLLGLIIFFSEGFAERAFRFMSQKMMRNFAQKAQKNGGTFYYGYTETHRTAPRSEKPRDPNVLDAEYTEIPNKKIDS